MPEVGERYLGTVVKTVDFGAFVSLLPGRDGLLHISKLRELNDGKRVEKVEDVVSVGQKIQVEIAELGDRGKLSLIPVIGESGEPVDEPVDEADETADDSAEVGRRRLIRNITKPLTPHRCRGLRLRQVHGDGAVRTVSRPT